MKNNFYTWLIFAASFLGYTASMHSQITPDDDCRHRFSNVVFNQINSSTANIGWDWDDLSDDLFVEYGEKGFELGTGIRQYDDSEYDDFDTHQINSLEALTEYDVYLSTDCYSLGPISFTTTENDCNTNFYDLRGPNVFYATGRLNKTIYPSSEDERIRVVFDYIDVVNDTRRGSDYLYVYNGEDASAELLGKYTGLSNNIELVSTDASGALHFVFRGSSLNLELANRRGWDAQIICEEKPACYITPENFNIVEEQQHSVTLDWDYEDNSEFEEFVIEYGESGFELGTGTVVTTTLNNITINDLNSLTNYDAYLRVICKDGFYSGSRMRAFKTKLDYCTGDHFYDNGGPDGNIRNSDSTTTIYPSSENERIQADFISFDVGGNPSLSVYNGPDISSELVGEFFNTDILKVITSTHESGALTFQFNGDSSYGSPGWDAIINCIPKASCLPPLNLNALMGVTNATLTWEASSADDNSWVIEYGETGFELGSGTEIVTNETSLLIENLDLDTNYTVYIKTECSDETYSDLARVSFETTTLCGDHFYDTGGPIGSTQRGEDYIKTIFPSSEQERVVAEFLFFETYDSILRVYDGPDDSFALIDTYNNYVSDKTTIRSTHESGALTFHLQEPIDSYFVSDGWDILITCEDKSTIIFPVNNKIETVTGFDTTNQHNGAFETIDSGNTLQLNGNAWAKADFDYTITENTVLEFDVKITGEGEVHGILFDNNNTFGVNEDGGKFFQIAGSDTLGIQDYNTYTGTDWVSYSIRVGEFFTGDFNNLVFVADKDADPTTQESFFMNVNFSEQDPLSFPIDSTLEGITGFDRVNQHSGTFETIDSGNALQLTGNAWAKADLDYTITQNTVLEFDIKITGEGEVHGILFDNNNTFGASEDGGRLFQIAGFDTLGVQDYNTYSGNDWVSYSIRVGDFFTGDFENIVFVADKDADPTTQESFFRNVNFSEQIKQIPFPINGVSEVVTQFRNFIQEGTFKTIDNGNTLQLNGDVLVKADLNYTVTENTIMEFDVKITSEGDIHGIFLEESNSFSGSNRVFQIAGSEYYGLQDYRTYEGNDWVSYAIPVGRFYTGDFNYIVFSARKNGRDSATQESFFRNVNFSEQVTFPINNTLEDVTGFDTVNQHNGSFNTTDTGNTLQLNGNAWAKADLNYTITENTVMEFDAKITGEGEIHGITFDNDNTLDGNANERLFQISGSQIYGIQDYNTYSGTDWVSYSIPVGEFFTGDFKEIVFVADKDTDPTAQESFFRNVNLFNKNSLPINSTPEGVTEFDTINQHNGTFETIDDRNTLQLNGNAWVKIDFNYTVTENTVVEFDIKITDKGEIHGILLEDNNILDGDDFNRLFQISGSQIYGLQDYNTYEGNDWVSYAIPVGRFFTGDFNNIVFVADKDANSTTQESFFRNVNFSEQITFPINNTPEIITEYGRLQHFGTFETIDGGNTKQLNGNAWTKADLNYTVTENTIIEFDIKITGEGEVHGIRLDDDNRSFTGGDSNTTFQISGTQNFGIQDFNNYTGNDWVSYSIPVGEFFTGDFSYIVFIADKDADPATQESFFRNVNIFENTAQNLASKQISSLSSNNQIEASFVGPNPANEYIDIQSSFNQVISEAYVYSMNGSLIKKVTNYNSDKLRLDVSDIPEGMYIVNYIIEIESHTTRLVVNH